MIWFHCSKEIPLFILLPFTTKNKFSERCSTLVVRWISRTTWESYRTCLSRTIFIYFHFTARDDSSSLRRGSWSRWYDWNIAHSLGWFTHSGKGIISLNRANLPYFTTVCRPGRTRWVWPPEGASWELLTWLLKLIDTTKPRSKPWYIEFSAGRITTVSTAQHATHFQRRLG